MKRRTFIKAGFTLISVGIGAYLVFPTFKNAINKMLTKETSNLLIQPGSINQFIMDAERERFWIRHSVEKKSFIIIHTYSPDFLKNLIPYQKKYQFQKNQIIGQFLMSTDLFFNKTDLKQEVAYTEFYNPYKQACHNPFITPHFYGNEE
jgi:hypothetical protein